MLHLMQMAIQLPRAIWSAFPQLMLVKEDPTLRVVPNNSTQHNFGCSVTFIIFLYSKCSLRSNSHTVYITLSVSLVAVVVVEVLVDNFNPKKFFSVRLWNSYVLHSSFKSVKSLHTVRQILPLSSYKTASLNMSFNLGESIWLISWSHLTVSD